MVNGMTNGSARETGIAVYLVEYNNTRPRRYRHHTEARQRWRMPRLVEVGRRWNRNCAICFLACGISSGEGWVKSRELWKHGDNVYLEETLIIDQLQMACEPYWFVSAPYLLKLET